MFGNITFNKLTEPVTGTMGHINQQWFPFYTGIFTPTSRQHSHEWRQVNLENGIDLSIWRQFVRLKANKIIQDTGITFYLPDSSPYAGYIDGPTTWTGIFQNQIVKGLGVFETTHGLYQDWELTVVLRDSVAHLLVIWVPMRWQ
jgi:hypothetical protein